MENHNAFLFRIGINSQMGFVWEMYLFEKENKKGCNGRGAYLPASFHHGTAFEVVWKILIETFATVVTLAPGTERVLVVICHRRMRHRGDVICTIYLRPCQLSSCLWSMACLLAPALRLIWFLEWLFLFFLLFFTFVNIYECDSTSFYTCYARRAFLRPPFRGAFLFRFFLFLLPRPQTLTQSHS